MEKWTKEQAWEWYNKQPWIRGFCYVPSCCVGIVDMWQEYGWDEVKITIEKEMALAAQWGFNAVRVFALFELYLDYPKVMLDHLEEFIAICDKNNIKVMVCLGNDCLVPKEVYGRPTYGKQEFELGYHSGHSVSPHIVLNATGYSLTDEPEYEEPYLKYVGDIVQKFAQDERVLLWDIFNEPGNSGRDMMSYDIMKKSFEVAKSFNPIQPCGACCWSYNEKNLPFREIELKALEMSDVILYHSYINFKSQKQTIKWLKKTFDRPMFNTEWLHRIWHNNIKELFPYFRKNKIAAFNWGFVRGKSQTNEPWEWLFNEYHKGNGKDWDFSKWQHDLIRSNLEPYDFKEYEIIKKECALADKNDKK